jgi:predicted Zn-dependent protease
MNPSSNPRGLGPRFAVPLGWGGRALPAVAALLLCLGPPAQAGSIAEDGAFGATRESHDAPEPGPIRRTLNAPDWPGDFEIGLQAARAYAYEFGLVEDDTLLARIHRLGYTVTSQCGRPDILFTFHILDVPDANAFALPGGFIFLTRGMADLHLPDAVLANLLGHEASHVVGNHFSRAGRINTALSLLQTAVMVAAMLAPSTGGSSGYDRDPETGLIRQSLAGKDAAIQGTNLFGSVFKELLMRGYSRGLEFEADDRGRRYAARAGYTPGGGVALLEELHQHIYEDQEFGYWRTHPYFEDRVRRARAADLGGVSTPDSLQVAEYRRAISARLSTLAGSVLDEPTAMFLYQSALFAAPGGESSLEVDHRLLQIRRARLREQKPILRAYGPLIADYDSLLHRAGSPEVSARAVLDSLRAWARAERDTLDGERRELHPDYREILDRPQAATTFLELFLENYPEDADASAVRLRLAERYRLADRPDEAAIALAELTTETCEERVCDEMRRVLPLTRELTTSQRVLIESRSDSVRSWAAGRLQAQIAELDSLELGSRFLQRYPDSPAAAQVTEKMEGLALERYRRARLFEGMHDRQAALDGYNELILMAPKTKAAAQAREGIERIQATAER